MVLLQCRSTGEPPEKPMALRLTLNQTADDTLCARARRARTEQMIVIPQTDDNEICIGLYDVYTQSGSQYVVDITREFGCTCSDTEHNHISRCKHRRRVAMEISEGDLPAPEQPIGEYPATIDEAKAHIESERERLVGEISDLDALQEALA